MSTQPTTTNGNSTKAMTLAQELDVLKPEIAKVLPEHVTPDRFMRIVMTAIAQTPDLRNADRRSLLTSCVKCAQDGLVPDGREAALVTFGKQVQYMPMVAGILKKVRNSGELKSIVANVVYEADEFNYWVDDLGEHVTHKPNVLVDDRGKLLAVYAIAKTTSGGVYIEVMSRGQIEQVKAVSRSGDRGPWGSWYDEMARKTVIRRLSKRLPMSTDLEQVIRRDDELYDLNRSAVAAPSGVAAAKAFLGLPQIPVEDEAAETVDTETGEVNPGGTTSDDEPHQQSAIPQYDAETAEKALRKCKSTKAIEKLWREIQQDFAATDREMPLNVETAYDEMFEALEEKEAKL